MAEEVDIVLKGVDDASSVFKDVAANLSTSTSRMANAFNAVSRSVLNFRTLLLAGGLSFALKQSVSEFADFEQALFRVRKTTDLSVEQIGKLGAAISELSLQLPISAKELGNTAAVAGQLGIRGSKNIFDFTKAVSQIGVVTDLNATEAATAFARVANATKTPIQQIGRLASVVNELENTTASNANEIVQAMFRMASSAGVLKVSAADIAALGASAVESGLGAERAGTIFRTVFDNLATNASKAAKIMGISTTEMKRRINDDAVTALLDVVEKIRQIPGEAQKVQATVDVFGKVGERGIGIMVNNLELFRTNLATARQEFEANTSVAKELTIFLGSFANQAAVASNAFNILVRSVGKGIAEGGLRQFVLDLTASLPKLEGVAEQLGRQIGAIVQSITARDILGAFQFLATAIATVIELLLGFRLGLLAIDTIVVAIARTFTQFFKFILNNLDRMLITFKPALQAFGLWSDKLEIATMQARDFARTLDDNMKKGLHNLANDTVNASTQLNKLVKNFNNAKDQGKDASKAVDQLSNAEDNNAKSADNAAKATKTYSEEVKALAKNLVTALDKFQDPFVNFLDKTFEFTGKTRDAFRELGDEIIKVARRLAAEDIVKTVFNLGRVPLKSFGVEAGTPTLIQSVFSALFNRNSGVSGRNDSAKLKQDENTAVRAATEEKKKEKDATQGVTEKLSELKTGVGDIKDNFELLGEAKDRLMANFDKFSQQLEDQFLNSGLGGFGSGFGGFSSNLNSTQDTGIGKDLAEGAAGAAKNISEMKPLPDNVLQSVKNLNTAIGTTNTQTLLTATYVRDIGTAFEDIAKQYITSQAIMLAASIASVAVSTAVVLVAMGAILAAALPAAIAVSIATFGAAAAVGGAAVATAMGNSGSIAAVSIGNARGATAGLGDLGGGFGGSISGLGGLGGLLPGGRVGAGGGLIVGPTLLLAGEAGPEILTPLTGPNAPEGLTGGGNVTITNIINVDEAKLERPSNMKEFVDELSQKLGQNIERGLSRQR